MPEISTQINGGMSDQVACPQTQGARTPIGVSGNSLLYILAQDHWNLKILVSLLLWGEETRKIRIEIKKRKYETAYSPNTLCQYSISLNNQKHKLSNPASVQTMRSLI